MNTIYFVRHGENLANITKEFSHRVVDYPLTDKGRLQAEQTAERFKNIHIDYIYSSPLKRAQETASYIARIAEKPIELIEELREVNVGSLELAKPTPESWDIYLKVFRAWKKGEYAERFPDGENYHELLARMKNALFSICAEKSDAQIVIVGHGGIMSATMPKLCRSADPALFHAENMNCSVSTFTAEVVNGVMDCKLVAWGDYSHLSGPAAVVVSGYPDFIKRS